MKLYDVARDALAGPLPPLDIEPEPYDLDSAMERARAFNGHNASVRSAAQQYARCLFVRGEEGWATDGARLACLPLAPGIAQGLHREGAGWAEADPAFALDRMLPRPLVRPLAVSTVALMALAKYAQAMAQGGASVPALAFSRGEQLLVTPCRYTPPDGDAAPTGEPLDLGAAPLDPAVRESPTLVVAANLVPVLQGAGAVIGLAMQGHLTPLHFYRVDGERHLLMPVTNRLR